MNSFTVLRICMHPDASVCADCVTCVNNPACGWCGGNEQRCMPGTAEEPSINLGNQSVCVSRPDLWHFEQRSCGRRIPAGDRPPTLPDALFDPNGPPVESLIPQLQLHGLFPNINLTVAPPPPPPPPSREEIPPTIGADGHRLTPTEQQVVMVQRTIDRLTLVLEASHNVSLARERQKLALEKVRRRCRVARPRNGMFCPRPSVACAYLSVCSMVRRYWRCVRCMNRSVKG